MNYSGSCQKYDVACSLDRVEYLYLTCDGGHLKKISDHFDSGHDWIAPRRLY